MRTLAAIWMSLVLASCQDATRSEGPGTETETVQACLPDGRAAPGATMRQIASSDWLALRHAGRSVVLDSCTTDSTGSCTVVRRPGVVWEAARGDSLLGWSEGLRVVMSTPVLWAGRDSAGVERSLHRTSIVARTSASGLWAASAPRGRFIPYRRSGATLVQEASIVLDSATESWDSTISFAGVVSLMEPGGPFRLEWVATSMETPSGLRIVDPSVPLDFERGGANCVGICPKLEVVPSPSSQQGMAARIRLGLRMVRIVGSGAIHIRIASTVNFQTMMRGGGGNPGQGSVTWRTDPGFDPDWVVYLPTGALDTLSLETTNLGILRVLDVQIRDSTGVRLTIVR